MSANMLCCSLCNQSFDEEQATAWESVQICPTCHEKLTRSIPTFSSDPTEPEPQASPTSDTTKSDSPDPADFGPFPGIEHLKLRCSECGAPHELDYVEECQGCGETDVLQRYCTLHNTAVENRACLECVRDNPPDPKPPSTSLGPTAAFLVFVVPLVVIVLMIQKASDSPPVADRLVDSTASSFVSKASPAPDHRPRHERVTGADHSITLQPPGPTPPAPPSENNPTPYTPRRPSPPPGVVSSPGSSRVRRSSSSSSGHLKIYNGTFQRPRRRATQSPIKRANIKRGPIVSVFQAATSLQQLLRKDKKLDTWKNSGLQIDALIKLASSENQNTTARYKTIKETEDLLNRRALWSAEQLNYMKQKPFVDLKRAVQHYLNVKGR
jgi:hypothetical protein